MICIIVCFNLALPLAGQMQQITYWLDFLNSSLSLPPPLSIPKWKIILVGVRSDEQQDFSLTQNSNLITTWKNIWPQLPISSTLFTTSSLKSAESVTNLFQFVEKECGQIFDHHATQIPSKYQKVLSKLQDIAKENDLIHWKDFHNKLEPELQMGEAEFKTMLQYIKAIGRIVLLLTGFVFTDPTIAPKIAAKFVSPKEVRLALLKQETAKVQILDETDIGCLLDIDTTKNNRYISNVSFLYSFLFYFYNNTI